MPETLEMVPASTLEVGETFLANSFDCKIKTITHKMISGYDSDGCVFLPNGGKYVFVVNEDGSQVNASYMFDGTEQVTRYA
jgi:hypothetical protein